MNEWSDTPLISSLMRKYSLYFRVKKLTELFTLARAICLPLSMGSSGSRLAANSLMKSHRRPPFAPTAISLSLLASLLFGVLIFGTGQASADDLSHQDRFFAQLAAQMTSIVDGKPFREGLQRIADQAGLNLWLDRGVDPTAPIEAAGPVGPTVYAAITKLAEQRGCVVLPVANVVLVGRPDRVDEAAASILQAVETGKPQPADVRWNSLTTPEEALAQAAGVSVASSTPLPHDLWPATQWNQIDRRVAVTLVLAQFGLRAESTRNLQSLPTVKAVAAGRFKRRYSRGKSDAAVRQALRETDRNSVTRSRKDWLEATASIEAHRAATNAMLTQFAPAGGPDPNKDKFSLKKLSTTAENALTQLAATARRACVIEPAASERCKTMITVEGVDVTLHSLVEMVAKQAGVKAKWTEEAIVISVAE